MLIGAMIIDHIINDHIINDKHCQYYQLYHLRPSVTASDRSFKLQSFSLSANFTVSPMFNTVKQ